MKQENFYPVDLGDIQNKALHVKHNLEVYMNTERSLSLREKHILDAINVVNVVIRDIDYLFDTKIFNGKRALGLDDNSN